MRGRSAVFIGAGTLPVRATEVWLRRGHRVVAVVSPDEPLRALAQKEGLLALDPGDDLARALRPLEFDHLFSVSSPWVLGREVLGQARLGAVRFHDALLPRYAGSHATSWAIFHEERTHGVTWHALRERADAGDILIQLEVEIAPDERGVTLNAKCWEAGARAFEALVAGLEEGTLVRRPQDPRARTFFARFRRPPAGAVLSLSRPAEALSAMVRALDLGPYPNALGRAKVAVEDGDGTLRFLAVARAEVLSGHPAVRPGQILEVRGDRIVVGTATAPLALSGLTTLEGGPAPPISPARPLPELDAPMASALEALDRDLAPAEDFWLERLGRAAHGSFRLAPSPSAEAATLALPVPRGVSDAALIAAWASVLAQATGREMVTLGLEAPAARALPAVFAPMVPLVVDLGASNTLGELEAQVARALEDADEHGTFARDLVTRYPQLGGRTFSPGALVLRADGRVESGTLALVLSEPRILAGRETAPRAQLEALAAALVELARRGPDAPRGRVAPVELEVLAQPLGVHEPRRLRRPQDALESKLCDAFERALGRAPIGVDEDFFALGGTSLSALRLFGDLGLELSLATLLSAPTVERLAAHLARAETGAERSTEPDDGSASVCVPLQVNGTRRPLFLVATTRGDLTRYAALARHLGPEQPLFALVPLGLDGLTPPDRRVEERAARNVAALRSIAPEGPFLLGGASLGGTIAFEMAQRLVRAGEAVGLLALFDTNPPETSLRSTPLFNRKDRGRRAVERAARGLRALRSLGPADSARRLVRELSSTRVRLGELPERLRAAARRRLLGERSAEAETFRRRGATRLEEANAEADAAYTRRPYAGRVTLFYGQDTSLSRRADLRLSWSDSAGGGFEVLPVPGDQLSMWQEPQIRVLAEKLGLRLERAARPDL